MIAKCGGQVGCVIQGFEQSGAGSGHLALGVLNGKQIDNVDQCC